MGDFPPPPRRAPSVATTRRRHVRREGTSRRTTRCTPRARTTIAVRLSEASPPRPVRFPRYSSRIAPPSPSFRDPRPARAPLAGRLTPPPRLPVRRRARHQAGRHADARDALLQALGDLTREPKPQTETAETEGGSRRSAHSPTDARASVVAALRRVVDATPLAELCDAVSSAVSWAESPRSRADPLAARGDPSSYLFDTCPTKCLRANSRGGFATSSSNASASGETRRRTRSPRRRRRRNERERKRTRVNRTPRVVSASPRVGFWQLRAGARISLGGTSRRRSRMRDSQPRARAEPRDVTGTDGGGDSRSESGPESPPSPRRRARFSPTRSRRRRRWRPRASPRLRLRLRLRSRFRNRRRA